MQTKTGEERGIGSIIAPEEEIFDNMTPEEVTSSHDKEHGNAEGSDSPMDIPLEPMRPPTSHQDPETAIEVPPGPAF